MGREGGGYRTIVSRRLSDRIKRYDLAIIGIELLNVVTVKLAESL